MIKSRRKAPVWKHFVRVADGKRATCNHCNKSFSTQDGNTTNCKNHLKAKHTYIFLNLEQEQAEQEDDADADDMPVDEEESRDGASEPAGQRQRPTLTPSPSPSPTPGPSRSRTLSPSPGPFSPPQSPSASGLRRTGSSNSFHQETLDSFTAPDSRTTERLHIAVTHYIVKCQRPLNTVEKEGFRNMLKEFKPGYKILSRRALTDKYIPALVGQVKAYLKSILKDAQFYALTSDNWTSTAEVPFTSLTAHFIDPGWEGVQAVTLSCRATHTAHTGVNLEEFFREEIDAWNLKIANCSAITTDNAAELRLSAELLNIPHNRCVGHTVQNGVTDLFDVPEVKAAISAVKTLVNWLGMNRVWNAYSKYVEVHFNGKALAMPSTSPTRWWSLLYQFELLEMHEFLLPFAASFERGKHLNKVPGEGNMFVIREVVRTLKPIEEICTKLCADTYITASAVLPVLHLLEAGFIDDDDPPKVPLDFTDPEFLTLDANSLKPAVLRRHIVKKLKKRYCPDPLNEEDLQQMTRQLAAQARIDYRCAIKAHELLVKCSWLDPRYRDELSLDERALAKQLLMDEYTATANPIELDAGVQDKDKSRGSSSLGGLFAKKRRMGDGTDGDDGNPAAQIPIPATPEAIFLAEVNRFSNIPNVPMDVDIKFWWKERMDTYPSLQRLARKYLSIPATSTTSERLFSQGGNIITDTRSCLSDEKAEALIFLSANSRFLKQR